MSRRTLVLLAVVALAAMALAACGGGASTGGSSNAAPLNVTVTATEFKFDPATINATAGQTINLTVKNIGTVQHTWVLAAANVKLTIDPGKTATATFTAPAAGTYQYECDLPGHKEAGMIGQLIVK